MSKPWPPPPDLHSIQELMRAADPERFLAEGAHNDEYELEEQQLFAAIKDLATSELIVTNLLPILERVWSDSFKLTDAALAERRPALLGLAQQIERFFGPQAQPHVRAS